ncbi:MAG: AtpZ/AtpI family protein [Rhodobacteraceae bacterium]|nr:AtpZ/AtpI family protein [Paracoccaceae bacterium]
MTEPEHNERLAQLDARITAAKKAQEPEPRADEHYSQAQLAWRMVIELVAGLGIGFGIGYGLDAFLGTSPILMVLFIFLGFAAGVKTMMRSAAEVQKKWEAEAAQTQDSGGQASETDKTDLG